MALSSLLRVLLLSVGFASVGSVPEHPDAGLSEKFRELLAQHDLSAGGALLDAFLERLGASQDPDVSPFAKQAEGVRRRRSAEARKPMDRAVFIKDSECADAVRNRKAELMNIFEGQGHEGDDDDGPDGCMEASGGCGPEVAYGVSALC